jgi:Bax protein
MSRFNRFAMAILGLATVALYGSRAVIALRDIAGPHPVPVTAAAAPLSNPAYSRHDRPRPVAITSKPMHGRLAYKPSALLHLVDATMPLVPTRDHTLVATREPAPRVLDAPEPVVRAPEPTPPAAVAADPATAAPADTVASADAVSADAPAHAPEPVIVIPLSAPDAEETGAEAEVVVTEPGTSVASVAELVGKFREADYRFEDIAAGRPVPRIIIRRFPPDLRDEEAADARKLMFLQALLPIVLYKNQEIRRDRERLASVHAAQVRGELSAADGAWLERLYSRYRVDLGDIDELIERVDVIPPSLALAQAATESGWGTSRSAREDNALFGQYADDGESYSIRSFDALLKSAQSYALNLNTHRAYRAMRAKRAEMRDAGKPLDGYVLASTLDGYSELGQKYVRYVRRMIKENRLSTLDQARLVGDDAALVTLATD